MCKIKKKLDFKCKKESYVLALSSSNFKACVCEGFQSGKVRWLWDFGNIKGQTMEWAITWGRWWDLGVELLGSFMTYKYPNIIIYLQDKPKFEFYFSQ